MFKQNPQSSRQNSRPNQQIENSFLNCGSKSFRLKFARCCFYTMDASAPKAEAIAVAGGRLVFVGDARRARALLRRGGRTIKLAPGQSVLPGFVDSHVHMIE